MRVMGVDPGSIVTGFGVVEAAGSRPGCLDAGVIRTDSRADLPSRLLAIHDRLSSLIGDYAPGVISLERSFVAANVQSAFRIGEARAAVLLAAARNKLPVFEYAPAEVKLTVAGYGRAGKSQVKFMVRQSLRMADDRELADDASDALALALCHLSWARMGMHERHTGRGRKRTGSSHR